MSHWRVYLKDGGALESHMYNRISIHEKDVRLIHLTEVEEEIEERYGFCKLRVRKVKKERIKERTILVVNRKNFLHAVWIIDKEDDIGN